MKHNTIINSFSHFFGLSQLYSNGNIRYSNILNNNIIYITKLIKDITDDKVNKYLNTYITNNNNKLNQISSLSINAAVHSISPSNNITISLYNNREKDNNVIEINYNTGGLYRLDVSEVHSNFASDSWFGDCTWSNDEKYFIYVANIKINNKKTYFNEYVKDTTTNKDNKVEEQEEFDSTKYRYVDDWGEKFTGVEKLGLFVLDIVNKKVTQVPNINDDILTVGQPCLINNNNENERDQYILTYTAWKTSPRKLGMVYCYQRPCSIYAVNITDLLANNDNNINHVNLTTSMKTARSPRCTADGKYLAFLGNKMGFDSHNGCFGLYSLSYNNIMELLSNNNNNDNINTIVDIVDNPATHLINGKVITYSTTTTTTTNKNNVLDVTNTAAIPFPGIYCDQLPKQCFHYYKDNNNNTKTNVILPSQWGSNVVMLSISLDTGDISIIDITNNITKQLNESANRGSCDVLEVQPSSDKSGKSNVLCTYSTPSMPQVLAIIEITNDNNIPTNCQIFQSFNKNAVQLLPNTINTINNDKILNPSDLNWHIFQHNKDNIPFESILLYPATTTIPDEGFPLVLVPHGGPHSCLPTSYLSSYAFLSSYLNCAVLYVNYRGSTGFGQNSISSLLGKIGTNDVSDMVQCLDHAKTLKVTNNKDSRLTLCTNNDNGKILINKDRVSVVGGSHGGFLSGHLIGQYPNMFKAACLRNPVTNIPSMVGVSDIPDWCYIESLGNNKYNFDSYNSPSEEQLIAMRRCSPVAYIDNVKTPTLLCIGNKDRRVPPSQGLEYYHLLRSRGVKTRLIHFPEDDHAIDKPASEAEHWVIIANWIKEHCCD